ncbi:MAG: hypothetical protein K8L99_00500, partial [Anaerolineae bacterium]|nr:hypothetical protein [Anaerolineae bacterium]
MLNHPRIISSLIITLGLSVSLPGWVTMMSRNHGLVNAQVNSIEICDQIFYYGDQAARSAQVWQYQSPTSDVTETYIVEDFRGTSVCSHSLVDTERDVVFFQEGNVRQYQRASDTRPEFPCAEPLASEDISGSAVDEEYRVTYN